MRKYILILGLVILFTTGAQAQIPDLSAVLPQGGGTAAGRIIQLIWQSPHRAWQKAKGLEYSPEDNRVVIPTS
jgi:hypothetical protein